MRRNLIVLLILLNICSRLYAGYRFIHINTQEGLPHMQVEGLAKDKDGYIWMGTRNGLSKYDGYKITTYYHTDSDNNTLSHNFIHALLVDKRNRLWIATETQICRYRPETNDFKRYDSPRGLIWTFTENSKGNIFAGGVSLVKYNEEKDEFEEILLPDNNFVNSLAVDKDDNLYVSTNISVFIYNPTQTKVNKLDPSYYNDFTEGFNVVFPIFIDSKQRLWMGRNGQGVMCVDIKNEESKIYPASQLSNGIVRTICEDQNHRIWLGTEGGISIINANGDVEYIRHQYLDKNSLSDNAVFSILFDNNDNAWIGTYFGGVNLLLSTNEKFNWLQPGNGPSALGARLIRNMQELEDGVFWFASEDNGIWIYNSKTNSFSQFDGVKNLGKTVCSLYYDKDTRDIWIGTRYNGLFRYNLVTKNCKQYLRTNGLQSEGVTDIIKDRNGTLWVATMAGLTRYNSKNDTFLPMSGKLRFESLVHSLFEDKEGNIWVATTNNGLFCINQKTLKITSISKNDNSGLNDNYITSVLRSKDGLVWIGTNNHGLLTYNPATGKVNGFDSHEILSRCSVCSIVSDRQGNIWVTTPQGLFEYMYKDNSFTHFSHENGLPVNQFEVSSSLLASDGRIYQGTIDGVIVYDPTSLKTQRASFDVRLKTLFINDSESHSGMKGSPLEKALDFCDKLVLSSRQGNSFAIEYGVVMPENTTNIVYQVWMEGVDKTWKNVGNVQKYSFQNLSHGKYKLHIRANDSNEGWDKSPERVIEIIVRPPFYQTIWAYLFYMLLLGAILYFIWRYLKARDDARIAQMEKEKLQELDSSKFNFFTIVSHELKTPLSLIIAPLKIFAKKPLEEESRQLLNSALKSANKMESLINELVTFNKIETGSFSFFIQKGNPLDFISILVNGFYAFAQEKNISLQLDCENNGEEVWFSPAFVEKIMCNLLSNAFKFTPSNGTVSVRACITTLDTATPYLYFEVADSGIGIAEEEQEHVFDYYYQTKRGYNRNNSGWGIGLSLVKKLVEKNKGKISISSKIGEGTSFSVWLDVSKDDFPEHCWLTEDKVTTPLEDYKFSEFASVSEPEQQVSVSQKTEKTTLLIVDDNDDLRVLLGNFFAAKYNILYAQDGKEALQILHKNSIQLIISDVMMPEMDGYELCRQVKQNMETSHIPIILLTARNENEDARAAYHSGADGFVTKPFDPNILDLQVHNTLKRFKSLQQEMKNIEDEKIEELSINELDKEFVQKMSRYVDENITNSELSVVDITRELGVSRTLLHIKMKNLFNMSMGDYIRKKRLDLACKMLREGRNVSETAYATGFSDPNWFSKTFKKHIGVSPKEYVQSINR